MNALRDLPRSARPPIVGLTTRLAVVQLACQRPDEKNMPFRNLWTHAALAAAVSVVTGVLLSVSEIGRILRFNDLRPQAPPPQPVLQRKSTRAKGIVTRRAAAEPD